MSEAFRKGTRKRRHPNPLLEGLIANSVVVVRSDDSHPRSEVRQIAKGVPRPRLVRERRRIHGRRAPPAQRELGRNGENVEHQIDRVCTNVLRDAGSYSGELTLYSWIDGIEPGLAVKN